MPYGGYKGITIKFGADTTELGKALKQIDNETKESRKNVTELNKALKADPKNVDLMANKYKELASQIQNTKKRLDTLKSAEAGLKSALDNGTEGAKDNWEAYQQELKRTETRLKTLEKQAGQTTNALKSQLTEGLKGIKTQLSSVVKILTTAETAFVGLSAKAVKTGMDFDSAMSQVAATMGKSTDEISNLRDYAQQMGETTAFSATESAQALNYMALAGYDAEKSMQMLPNVLNLAAAGGLDLASASDMVTDAQSALGLSMENTNKLVDQMATTASKSNTSVGQLGEAILTVGGTAKALKGGTTEMATALGILADNGVKSAEGGTALRNIILSLTAPTSAAAKELDKLGIAVNDENGNVRALNDIFNDLSASLDGMGTGERTQVLNEIFNKVDLKSVNALLSNCGQRFDELSGYIDKANGSSKQMANTQLDNLQGDLTLLKSAAEGLQIAVSDKLTPSFRDLAQEGTQEISKLTEEIKNGGLFDTFEQVGKDLSVLVKNGITTAAQMLPSVIKLLSGITAHIDTIIKLLVAYKGLNILSTTIKNITTIGSALKGIVTVLGSVEKAGALKSIAGVASKIGGVSTALGALSVAAGGVYLSYKAIKDYSPEEVFEMLDSKTQNVLTSTNELCKSVDNLNKEYDNNLSSIKSQTSENQRLSDEIYTLAGNENLSVEQKEKLKAMIDQLNHNIPTLNAKFDESTNSINLTKDATDELIKKQDEYNRYIAASDLKTDLYKQQLEIEQQIADTKEQIKQKEKEIAEYQAKNGVGVNNDERKAFFENDEAVSRLRDSLSDLNNKQDEVKSKMKSVNSAINKNKDGYNEITKAQNKQAKAAEESASATDEMTDALDNQQQKIDNYKSELLELVKTQKQLNEGQSLSTDSVLTLIEKYPQLASAIRSTKDGYVVEQAALNSLIQTRIENIKQIQEEKIATLEKQKAENDASYNSRINAIKNKQVSNALKSGTKSTSDVFSLIKQQESGGNKMINLIKSQRDKTNATINSQLKTAKAQYSALSKIYNDIANGNYKTGSTSTSTTTSSAKSSTTKSSTSAKKAQKSEEDNYKKHVEKLLELNEYKYNMGKKSEAQYYAYIKKIRDKYYNNTKAHQKKYASEIRDLNLQLHNYAKETAEKTAEIRKKNAETTKAKIESLENKYINGSIKSKNAYVAKLKKLQSSYIDSRTKKVKKGYEESNKLLKQAIKDASKVQKQAQAEAEKRATEKAKSTGSSKESYYDWQYNMSSQDLKAKQTLLKHYQDIDNKYYKNKKGLAEEHRQMLLKIKNLQDDIASEQKRLAEENLNNYKSNVEKQKDALTSQLDAGKIDAFAYYKKLQELNDKYYKHRKDCAEEYATLQKEINEGIKQAQEDNINNIIDLSEKTNDVIQATEKLRGAEKKQKIYYDTARGFYHGADITAVTEARTDLYNAQKDLMQQAISLNGNLTASELSKILSNLPSFSGISLPSTTTNNSNKTVSNSFVFSGDIKTENPEEFLKQINNYVKQSGIDLMIGR